ncbi:MAG: DUF362 domain-containing protein [Candidatus Thorarchaeota archaeon]|jgi:uncharacterized protein (DUF362 family)
MESKSEVAIGLKRSPGEALKAALSKLNQPIAPPRNIKRVIIKPSIYNPSLPGNTDVGMVRAVIRMFSSLGPVSIVESDNPLRTTADAFLKCGYKDLEDRQIELVNLTETDMVSVTFPGRYFEDRKMPRILHEDNFFINVATLKAEPEICKVGAGIKNLFGLLPELDKSVYHSSIDDVLMDLLDVYRPNLSVIDLTRVVVGNRADGVSKHVGGAVVGFDPVAVDSFCSSLLGIDSMKIDHLRSAHELGMGEALSDRITVRGTKHQIEELNRLFKK